MNYTTISAWGRSSTPPLIKTLIIIISIVASSSAALQSVFDLFQLFPGPQNLLSLSWWGMKNGFIWQPISFLFIHEALQGLTFSFFITLIFNLYVFWIIGSTVFELLGKGPFLRLYFLGTISAAFLTLFWMKITGQDEMLVGTISALCILLTVWIMAFPESELHLLFLLPIKIKWLAVSLVGFYFLTALMQGDLPKCIFYLFSVLIGYGYGICVHNWYSPFSATLKMDLWLSRQANWIKRVWPFSLFRNKEIKTSAIKIVDISSGQPIKDDNAFIDAMLAKISKYGENSLSWSEKKRMEQISKNKFKPK